jgi:integrase
MSQLKISKDPWKSRAAKGLNAHVVTFDGEQKFFATRAEAKAHYDKIVINEAAGGHVTSKHAATFSTAAATFERHIDGKVKAGVTSAGQQRSHRFAIQALLPIKVDGVKLADVMVSDLTAGHVSFDILPGLAKGRAPKSVHNYYATLTAILRFATVKGWSATNPAQNVRASDTVGSANKSADDKAERISPDRIAAIIAASGRWSTAIAFAASTGLRQGEQRGLQWKHINFDRGFVEVRQAKKADNEIGTTKTKAGKRDVPLQDGIIAQLRELRLASAYSADDDFVFPARDGRPLCQSVLLKDALLPACAKAGVDPICWHDLRHYFASRLLETMQDDLWTVAQILGHKEISTTQTIYGHWLANDERDQRIKDRIASINF